jgi:hypothetical protein
MIGELAVTDEEMARHAREQYREAGIPTIESDPVIATYLAEGEGLLGYRPNASLGRVDEATSARVHDEGPLYVTDRRLVHHVAGAVQHAPGRVCNVVRLPTWRPAHRLTFSPNARPACPSIGRLRTRCAPWQAPVLAR